MIIFIVLLAACGQSESSVPEAAGPEQTTENSENSVEGEATAATTPISAPSTDETTAGGRSIGDSYSPELGNTGYDVQHYTIQLNLSPKLSYQLEGTTKIDILATQDNLGELSLDFIGFDISELLVDGQTVEFEREDDKLIITLPEPVNSGGTFQMSVTYAGETVQDPSPYVGFATWLGMFYAREDTIYVLSEPDGSRFWFPNNDHPRDKATYRFEVTVPDGLTAVANGALLDFQDDTQFDTYIWEHNFPMASYLATVVVGEYERVEDESPQGIPLRHYLFPENQEAFDQSTSMTGEAIDWMGELFGEYPYDEYGYVTVHAPGVSLETQTIVLLSTGMLNERTVIHELAHMWFGDWVSLDSWGEMWRNEGFATYISIMWDHRDDLEGLELEMAGIEAAMEQRGPFPPIKDPEPEELFGGFTYFGGALMVHELRQEMGDEAFFAGLQNYFQQYGNGTASDEEFIAIMEEASGKDLGKFFRQWFEG
ncbi:MAG: M1 family metallopeptidase [Chloroflexi bacterium]|nr:M1 family metallopeptidase [Chloroflexota bacterium]